MMFRSTSSSSGTSSSTPAFGTPTSTPTFGAPSSTTFGTPSSTSFGTPPFGNRSSTPAFEIPSAQTFRTPSSTPLLGSSSSTPSFGSGFGASIFSTPYSTQTLQQQQRKSLFSQTQSTGLGFQSSLFATPAQQQTTPFPGSQLTTRMAPVTPLPFSLADRDIQAIVDAYNEEPGNPKYAFQHFLFSVTDPQHKGKPPGVSDIKWAEAMAKLEGMESTDRERLWPQLVQGFKDLSQRLKLQDEVIVSDAERLRTTQSNVKMLQRHLQADTLPWIERMRHKEQGLQRRLMRVMRILEVLESKGCRLALVKPEAELAEKLVTITRQVSQQQTEAVARLGNVLKRDIRDMENWKS